MSGLRRARWGATFEVVVLVATPLVLVACALGGVQQAAFLSMLMVVASLVIFFGRFEASRPPLRQIMPTTVLASLAVVGRILFAPLPDVKPVSALCILAGIVFGRRSGFMVGALAALVSNFFFGQGPWTPWQMYAWGLVGYLAGVLADHGAFKRLPVVYAYGFVSPLLYGFLLNTWFIIGFVHPFTPEGALLAYGAGLAFDLTHAVATVVFLVALYAPWRKKLLRIKQKYALG